MRDIYSIFRVFVVVALLGVTAIADEQDKTRDEAARLLVRCLADAEFEKAAESFDKAMKNALPADKLKQTWDGVIRQFGPFQETIETRKETYQQYHIVYVIAQFERGKFATKVVFSSDNKIGGLFFQPAGDYKPPAYANRSKFEESDITVGKGFLTLPGTLAIPKGEGTYPGLVLVHGSGPNDRDETLGPNKPFRDLAHGLASRGIAVLRYEKRTKHHALVMGLTSGSITVKEETVDDAAEAIDALAAHPRVDAKRVFVLGHSLGGMLLPRIAAMKEKIAGSISLAGSTRPLEDLIVSQTKYIFSLEKELTNEHKKFLSDLETQVVVVKSLELSRDTPKEKLPFGFPASYWLDLRSYAPAEAAKTMKGPLLFLQGERDYQVTMEDFGQWKKALANRKDATFISYPALNHLFMKGEGKSVPAEYLSAGNVAEEVVADIARWIKSP